MIILVVKCFYHKFVKKKDVVIGIQGVNDKFGQTLLTFYGWK